MASLDVTWHLVCREQRFGNTEAEGSSNTFVLIYQTTRCFAAAPYSGEPVFDFLPEAIQLLR
jgi:hypothetical protein